MLKFYHHHICNCSLNECITWGFKVSSMWQCHWVSGLWSSNYPEPLTHRHNITPQMTGVETAYLYECILIFYLHTQLWTLSSSGSLAITTYPEAEYKFHVGTILLFYFTENNCHNIKIAYFSKIYLYYHTSLQDSSRSNTSVTLELHKSMPCCYYWL